MAKQAKIELSRTIQAAPETVFRALSNATALRGHTIAWGRMSSP